MLDEDEKQGGTLAKLAEVATAIVSRPYINTFVSLISAILSFLLTFVVNVNTSPASYAFILSSISIIGVTLGYFGLQLFSQKFGSLTVRLTKLQLEKTLTILSIRGRKTSAKELALSVSYLESKKAENLRVKIALVVCSASLLSCASIFPELQLLNPAMVSSGVTGLLFLKEALLEYRIRTGFFGTNASEARDLIEYLVKNSDDIDFTDTSGRLRKALEPEKQSDLSERIHPAEGGANA